MTVEEYEGASQEHQNHKYHGIATEILKDRARHFMIFNDYILKLMSINSLN